MKRNYHYNTDIQKIIQFYETSIFYNVSSCQFFNYKKKEKLIIPREGQGQTSYILKFDEGLGNDLANLAKFRHRISLIYSTNLWHLKKLKSKKQMIREFKRYLKNNAIKFY